MRQLLAALLIVAATAAAAVEPDEILDDPVLEARAREISRDIRCVVCQNEPIDSPTVPTQGWRVTCAS